MKILIIEDNKILSRNLVKYFIIRDIFTEVSFDGEDGVRKVFSRYYDIIILDINLPKKSGLEVCREIRERNKDVSIIILTSRGTNLDIINGLDIGADDYLVKPFEDNELLARINAIYRRKMKNHTNTLIKVGNIELDIEKHEIRKNNKSIKVSKLEYDLFKFLAQNKGKALSREEIYKTVWGESDEDFMFSKTIDVYIGYLRKKFGKEIIETKKSYGFLIK